MVKYSNERMKRKGEKDVLAIGVKTLNFNSRLTGNGFFSNKIFFLTTLDVPLRLFIRKTHKF